MGKRGVTVAIGNLERFAADYEPRRRAIPDALKAGILARDAPAAAR